MAEREGSGGPRRLEERPKEPGSDRYASDPPSWLFAVPVLVGLGLRWFALGSPGLSADEMFTGVHSAEPLTGVISRVIEDDIHPPLDYLLRNPLAGPHDSLLLRAPSAVFASLALLLVWHWGRRYGWLGLWFVSLTALSSFQILYARTARPYALLLLCGTVVAWSADNWLRSKALRWSVVAALAALVALFADATGGLLVLGGLLVPGRARDKASWRWRGAMALTGIVFVAAWGVVTARQYKANGVTYLPLATPAYAVREVGRLAAVFFPDNGFVLVPLFVLGAVALRPMDKRLAWVLVSLCVAPIAMAVVAGAGLHFLVARALSSVAWGIPLTLAALLEWARRRSVLLLFGVAALVALLVVPSIPHALSFDEEAQAATSDAARLARPGDAVVMVPAFLSHNVEWSFQTPRQSTPLLQWNDANAYVALLPGAPFTGRLILISAYDDYSPADVRACPGVEPRHFGMYTVSCYQVASGER